MAKGSTVVTPEFRVSYPKVFKAEVNKLSNKLEYSLVALFPKDADLSALKAAAKEAVVSKWGPDSKKWPQNLKQPFRDQGEKIKADSDTGKEIIPPGHERGAVFMTLKSEQRPAVVDKNVQPILEASEIYGGCYAKASIRAYAYDQAGNRGVSFGLGNIQKTRDGDSFGGTRSKPEDDFAPIQTSGVTAAGASAPGLFD